MKMSRNAAESAMAMAAERLAEFKQMEDTFGAEPQEGGMLRVFRDIHGRNYTYAFIKADNGKWYQTGAERGSMTWEEVLDLLGSWTLRHYEVVPAPNSQILPTAATYPCGHTDADHVEMFAPGGRMSDLADLIAKAESKGASGPLGFLDFLRSTGADVQVRRVPSLFGGLRPDVPAEPVAADEDGDDEPINLTDIDESQDRH